MYQEGTLNEIYKQTIKSLYKIYGICINIKKKHKRKKGDRLSNIFLIKKYSFLDYLVR